MVLSPLLMGITMMDSGRPYGRILLQLSHSISCPWILIGDFNIVMSQNERVSKVLFDQAEIDEFVACCDSSMLRNAPAIDHSSTWSNKQQGGKRIWAKLDRVSINGSAVTRPWTFSVAPEISNRNLI